jgi:hypothetical protein
LAQSKKRKFILARTATKSFNIRNNYDFNDTTNKNIDHIKNIRPINLFMKEKINVKRKSKNESQKNLAYIQIDKILNENSKDNKDNKNLCHEFKLPNINYNNIHSARKTKKKTKMIN